MKLSPQMTAKVLSLAGGVPALAPRRKPPSVLTPARAAWAVVLYPACRVVSESNQRVRGVWQIAARRAKAQKAAVLAAWWSSPLTGTANDRRWQAMMPLVVTLTHTGPRMDEGDNLNRAFKAVRDEVARLIGVDDGSECVKWKYRQKPGKPLGVEIRIEPRT